MKVYLKTYGCQMNVYDSEIMAGLLLVKGYEIAEDMNEADIILLNTCSIRKKANEYNKEIKERGFAFYWKR
ncbi:hypothetical protein KKD34_00355 [bacterium]|nr:hypothetical protein [bacterium]MBU4561416.1 hypothetical protein [bacterium]